MQIQTFVTNITNEISRSVLIYDFSFIPRQVLGFAVLRHVNAIWTDISCFISLAFPGSSGCSGAGPGGRQKAEKSRKTEWLVSSLVIGYRIMKN